MRNSADGILSDLRSRYIELCSPVGSVADGLSWSDALDGCADHRSFFRILARRFARGSTRWVPPLVAIPTFIALINVGADDGGMWVVVGLGYAAALLLLVWASVVQTANSRSAAREWRELKDRLDRLAADIEVLAVQQPHSDKRRAIAERVRLMAERAPGRSLPGSTAGLRPGAGPLKDLLARMESACPAFLSDEAAPEPRQSSEVRRPWPHDALGPVIPDDRAELLGQDRLVMSFDSDNSRTAWAITDSLGRIVGSVRTTGDKRDWETRLMSLHDEVGRCVFRIEARDKSGTMTRRREAVFDRKWVALGTVSDRLLDRSGNAVATRLGATYQAGREVLATRSERERVRTLWFKIDTDDERRLLILADWVKGPQPIVDDTVTGYP